MILVGFHQRFDFRPKSHTRRVLSKTRLGLRSSFCSIVRFKLTRFPHRVLRFPNKAFFDKVEQNVEFERSAFSFNLRKALSVLRFPLET